MSIFRPLFVHACKFTTGRWFLVFVALVAVHGGVLRKMAEEPAGGITIDKEGYEADWRKEWDRGEVPRYEETYQKTYFDPKKRWSARKAMAHPYFADVDRASVS